MPEKNDKNKLVPLRKFALPGVYSVCYLSQLVQRGKLKAEKIGRNYYTTEEWFDEYIRLHACDLKQDQYFEYQENNKKENKTAKDNVLGRTAAVQAKAEVGRTNRFKLYLFNLIAVFTAIFIFAVLLTNYFNFLNKDGMVAGESEENITSTSSINNINK